jgi:predicted ABC-type exoprotein transport system permease subunit
MKSDPNEYDNFKELIGKSKTDLTSYLEKRLTLAKLRAYEKLASSFSYIAYSLIVCLFALILFILFFLGLGLFIGEQLDNYSLGFGILTVILLIALVVIILNQKSIRRSLVNLALRTIKKIEKDED